jgi:hypothetical protein
MSEQPDQAHRPGDEDERPGAGARARENVRTAGETSVDEAMGAGEEPAR